MATMYADTLKSSLSSSPSSLDSVGSLKQPNMLQATLAENVFSTTQDAHGKNTYNWMTGGSVDTFSSLAVTEQNVDEPQMKSAVLAVRKQKRNYRQIPSVGSNFGKRKLESPTLPAQQLDIKRLRRKFQKEMDNRNRFARAAEQKNKQKKYLSAQERAKREHAVQMYRTYRIGELPDIQIPHRGIVAPLAALAQLDPIFSRKLLSSLVHSILEEEKKRQNRRDEKLDYIVKFTEVISRILTSSQQWHSTFIGCILDIIQLNASSIMLDPSIVAQAAIKSNQPSLGIRVLEEWLLQRYEPQEPTSKRRKLLKKTVEVSDTERLIWIELGRLFKGDFDTLQGIFTGTPVSRPIFSEAIHLETQSEFAQASRVYQKALLKDWDTEPSDVEKILWEDCLLACLRNLGKWSDLDKFCDSQLPDSTLGNAWSDPSFQQRFLSISLHSKMILLLHDDGKCERELSNFAKTAVKVGSETKNVIESKHADHFAMLHIYEGDYHMANHYLVKAMDSFAVGWVNSDPAQTMEQSRLQSMSDMADFVELMIRRSDQKESGDDMVSLVDRWSYQLPHQTHDSINIWEDMVTYRSFFVDQFIKNYSSSDAGSSQDTPLLPSQNLGCILGRKKLLFQLETVNTACLQKHFSMARKLLNKDVANAMEYLRSTEEKTEFSEIAVRHTHSTAQYYLSFAQHLMLVNRSQTGWSRASKSLSQAHKLLRECLNEKETDQAIVDVFAKTNKLLGQSCDLAADLLSESHGVGDVVDNLHGISPPPDDVGASEKVLRNSMRLQAYKHFETSIQSGGNEQEQADSFVAFLKFCDKMLQEREEVESQLVDDKEMAENLVKYTMKAMKFGKGTPAQEASLKIPRLLQLIDSYSGDVKSCFMSQAKQLPSWMFLRWSSQIVALLDKPEADAIHDMLSQLAQEYPQAIIYPIKTSVPEFHFTRDAAGKRNKSFLKKIHTALNERVPLADAFISNLCLLTSPAHIFKEWLEEIMQLKKMEDKTGFHKKILTKYQNMYEEVFACWQSRNSKETDALYGPVEGEAAFSAGSYRRDFAKKFRKDVESAFGGPTGGESLIKMNEKKFCSTATQLLKEMNEYCRKQKPGTLHEYSKWLADFHSINLGGQELEIPGQYRGNTKPMPEYHAKISAFEDSVLVMSSLQQPKRIRIKASDGHDYYYLVKGNEDLRQDQRVQQVFDVMNNILQKDPACWKRKLHIDTYQVIPVTSRLGLIEWLDNSDPLQDVIYKEAEKLNCRQYLDKPSQMYMDFVKKYSNNNTNVSPVKLYGNMVKLANHADTCNKYQEIISQVPQGLLRNAYLRLSVSTEAFLALRKRFSSTYGTLCIAHWMLGIGDRHTSNSLISKKTGAVVGIDFGHAFGTATEGLPVPELMPFRLSPQLSYLVAPHPAKHGALRQTMIFCLSALRSEQDMILTILDIFLKEPSVDWMKYASKMLRVHGSSVMATDSEKSSKMSTSSESSAKAPSPGGSVGNMQWYPIRKINTVKKKLSGWNPSEITRDELQHNYQVPKMYLSHYQAAATGLKNENLRTIQSCQNLSVDEQVDCLIDQATDPNILARSYVGWKFWL